MLPSSMSELKIAFQGYPGSYSDMACRDRYPDHEPLACEAFEDAFGGGGRRKGRISP